MSASAEEGSVNAILSRVREMQSDLPLKPKQIAALIIAQPEAVVHMSITDFSEACGVSEETIVAFCRRVGVRGFQELKIVLAQDLLAREAGAPTTGIMRLGKSPLAALCEVMLETRYRPEAMSTRVAQLAIMDTLVSCCALTNTERSVKRLQQTARILSQKRY
jgi:DNA-binding MurR/RpiR family transcriptional regulator